VGLPPMQLTSMPWIVLLRSSTIGDVHSMSHAYTVPISYAPVDEDASKGVIVVCTCEHLNESLAVAHTASIAD